MIGAPATGRRRLLAGLGAGLAAFALGAAMALAFLPEWRAGNPADPRLFLPEYRRLVQAAGLHLAAGEPQVFLGLRQDEAEDVYRQLGEAAAGHLAASKTGLRVRTTGRVTRLPGSRSDQELQIDFSLDGRPLSIAWEDISAPLFRPTDRTSFERLGESFARLLVAPGESFGPDLRGRLSGPAAWRMENLAGSRPPQHVLIGVAPPNSVFAKRSLGQIGNPGARPDAGFRQTLLSGLLALPVLLAVLGLFLTLLLRARIDLINGGVLSLVALLSSGPRWLLKYLAANGWMTIVGWLLGAPGKALAVLLTWSAGESLLRATHPDFTTSLDTLRRGRLGPRGGRALLVGFAAGAALAGLRLAIYSLFAALPGLSPAAPSVALPVFRIDGSPVADGIALASGVALAFALAVRLLPGRWAPWAAALFAGYALSPLKLLPYSAELAANVVFAGLLIWICRRFGLTALLCAATVSFLLPAALFSGLRLAWMPGSFAATSGVSAALLLLGFFGISRSEGVETEQVPLPPFMRRLAQERRINHEVDLLARMQLGLLPQEMPRIEGYQIAARSVLASEAGGDLYDFLRDDDGGGRLWIAAGDVAGHGYSCAVAQAMVKAGLLSLIVPEESPASVLRQLDRVLRGVSSGHSFTSLALIRLDLATGEALLGNAGYPYPMIFVPGRVEEIPLPGLPLGQGPARVYPDRAFQLPSGSVLLLCSDGLFEALDRNGTAYGYDRAREVLRAMGHRPALEIVDALLNDCRRHLDAEQAPDDVTVVVVKRG